MNEKVFENLRSVKKEALEILDNVEKVRGKRYRYFLSSMLLTTNMVEILHAMEEFGGDGGGVREKLRECFLHCLHQQMTHMFRAADVSDDDVENLVKDAEKIHLSINGLAHKAFETGMSGGMFGDQK